MTELDGISVRVDADTSSFDQAIKDSERLARGLGVSLTRAFGDAVIRGKDFGEVMRSLGMRISSLAINAAFKPIEQGIAGMFQGAFGAGAMGAQPANTIPFAKGGVISTPSYFPLGSSFGLAGESGAEAILPLARGADGKLGVRSGADNRPASVTVHVSTPDAASFRRSEAYVSGMIARAVARGERSL